MQSRRSISHDESQFINVLKYYNLYKEEPIYKVVCPFHGDKNPSMQINLGKEFFYCYGCGAHGGAAELVAKFNPDLTPIQVFSTLARIGGKGKRGIIGGVREGQYKALALLDTKDTYKQGIKLAKDYYYNLPVTNWYKPDEEIIPILRYMKHRGFTATTLKKYEAKATYNPNYPIVFPMYDNGIFRGYVMRTDDPFVEDRRKYLYNKNFQRRITLPGDYKNDTIVVVEGFLDMLKAKQYGIKYVAAFLGWKITSEQFNKIKRCKVKKIICALDNDECGRKGYKYLKRICKGTQISVVRIRYPKKMKDMGDLTPETAPQILKQIKQFGGK